MATRTGRKRRHAERRLKEVNLPRRLWIRARPGRFLWVPLVGLAIGLGVILVQAIGTGGSEARIIDPVRNEVTQSLGINASTGNLAPNFEATSLSGERVRLSDLQGKVVLVNFYASWCTACRKEIPAYQRIYDRYRDQGFEIVAVNNGESKDLAKRYLRGNGGRFTGVLDPDRIIVEAYRVRGMPVSVFIDRSGVVVKYVAGEAPEAAVDPFVKALVSESLAPAGDIAPVSTPAVPPSPR